MPEKISSVRVFGNFRNVELRGAQIAAEPEQRIRIAAPELGGMLVGGEGCPDADCFGMESADLSAG